MCFDIHCARSFLSSKRVNDPTKDAKGIIEQSVSGLIKFSLVLFSHDFSLTAAYSEIAL